MYGRRRLINGVAFVKHVSKLIGVVHVTQSSRSGAAKYVYELFKAFRIICAETVLVCPGDFEYRNMIAEAAVFPGRIFSGRTRFEKLVSMWRQLVDTARQVDVASRLFGGHPVVVHFNFPAIPPLALLQFRGLKRKGFKLVLTVHDALPHRWLMPKVINGLERDLLRRLYRAADGLVVHHASQREVLVRDFGIENDRVLISHHGVFRLADDPLPFHFGSDRVFLCFGAIRENKGVHLAVQAVQRLRAEGVRARLRIVGAVSQGERQYWNFCRSLIDAAPDGIEVVERFVGENELRGIFECADFCLLPYDDFFSQSGVATMALSSGRPVVCTSAGGLGELIGGGQFGVEIKDVSIDGVMCAIRNACLIDSADLEVMGREAFLFSEQEYSWLSAAEEQLEFYSRLLGVAEA